MGRAGGLQAVGVRFKSTFMEGRVLTDLKVERNEEKLLVDQPWTQRPFTGAMELPIFDFQTGKHTGEAVDLDPAIFNHFLRRDVIHNVFLYYRYLDY